MASAWKAVADDSRRQVLLLLREGEKTPSDILSHFEFTPPALSTHLRVLRDARLVKERREGRRRFYSVDPQGMAEIAEFLDQFWTDSLRNLKRHVEAKQRQSKRRRNTSR